MVARSSLTLVIITFVFQLGRLFSMDSEAQLLLDGKKNVSVEAQRLMDESPSAVEAIYSLNSFLESKKTTLQEEEPALYIDILNKKAKNLSNALRLIEWSEKFNQEKIDKFKTERDRDLKTAASKSMMEFKNIFCNSVFKKENKDETIDRLEHLIMAGANPNTRTAVSAFILQTYLSQFQLIDEIDIGVSDECDEYPLFVALTSDRVQVLAALLASPFCNPHLFPLEKKLKRATPLAYAIWTGNVTAAQLLIKDKRTKFDKITGDGQSAIDVIDRLRGKIIFGDTPYSSPKGARVLSNLQTLIYDEMSQRQGNCCCAIL